MKKLISFFKKYQLIIILAIIAGILAGFKLFSDSQQEPSAEITPTPTVSPRPSPIPTQADADGQGITEEEFVQELIENYPLTPYLPYPDDKYTIKYTAPKTIEISIYQATESASRQEVLDWIENQGVDPNSHQINWQF